jgi:zinc transporter ZupT
MVACCLIPLALIYGVFAFGISLGSLTPLLPYAFALLCPLLMFWMMRSMLTEHSGHDHAKHEHTSVQRELADTHSE